MPTRVPLCHTPPPFVPGGAWFFVTVCCATRGINSLCSPEIGPALLADAVAYHLAHIWRLHLFLLMPDHVHAVLATGAGGRLAEALRNWKRLTARRHGIRWQRNFFDHRLRQGESFELKCRYIRENPIRAGLVQHTTEWPFYVDASALEGR